SAVHHSSEVSAKPHSLQSNGQSLRLNPPRRIRVRKEFRCEFRELSFRRNGLIRSRGYSSSVIEESKCDSGIGRAGIHESESCPGHVGRRQRSGEIQRDG